MPVRGWLYRVMVASALAAAVAVPASAQRTAAVVTGRVTSGQNAPIAGANIRIDAFTLLATTDADGRYTLTVPAARMTGGEVVIIARAIGYKPLTRRVTLTGGTNTQDFQLERDINRLSEVVVTGTAGATEQRKLPFSVSSVKAEDLPVPATNPLTALQGKVPGANIVSASGRPGAVPSIVLRAPLSIDGRGEGQGPLFIVDGVVVTGGLADINALDIENVEVVRGAAAASLYGARAAKGVIQITTKSGRSANSPARFTIRSEYGQSGVERQVAKAENHIYKMQGNLFCADVACATTFDYLTELATYNNSPGVVLATPSRTPFIGTPWVTFQDGVWPGRTYNAIDEITTPGAFANNDVSVTGRVGGTSYFASINQTRSEGAIIGLNGYVRNGIRLNLDQRIGSKLNLSFRSAYSRSREDGNQFDGGGAFFTLTRMPAIASVLSLDTLGRRYVRISLDGENSNPIYELENNRYDQINDRFLGSTKATYAVAPWLDFEADFAIDRRTATGQQFRDKGFRTLRSEVSQNNGSLSASNSFALGLNTSFQANMRRSFFEDRLQSRLQLRYLYEQQDGSANNFSGNQFAVGGIQAGSNLSQPTLSAGSSATSVRQIGYFAIANLDFLDRYILDGVIRRDGSSLFGVNNRWATFGRGSFAWRLSEEPWFSIPGVSDLKLRASVGQAGTRPTFSAQYETYSVSGGVASKATLGNNDIAVQVATERELGMDLQLLDRYTLTANVVGARVTDQIVQANLPAAVGFSSQWRNAGTVETKSFELALELPIIERTGFSWRSNITWDRNISEITEFPLAPYQDGPANMFYVRAGERLGTMYGVRWAKTCADLPSTLQGTCDTQFQVNDDGYLVWVGEGNSWQEGITKSLWGTTGPTLPSLPGRKNTLTWGVPFAAEENGTAYLKLGSAIPDFRWSMANNIQVGDWSVYALLDATVGKDVYNYGRHWSYFENYSADQDQAGKTDATKKPYGYYGSSGLYDVLGPNSHFIEDASFIKLREFAVSYRLRRLAGIRGDWNLSLIGRNLLTITDYKGFDPEVGSSSGRISSAALGAIDDFRFPNLRSFTFSVSTSF